MYPWHENRRKPPDERVKAMRKAANANLATLPQRAAAARRAREEAAERKRAEREARRAYMLGLRAAAREAREEIKALRRVVRDYYRRGAAGLLTKQEWGSYDEADHRLDRLCAYLAETNDLIKRGW